MAGLDTIISEILQQGQEKASAVLADAELSKGDILSHAKVKYKKVTVKNNKLYCRKGKKQALSISTVSKVKKSNNKTYKWKGN